MIKFYVLFVLCVYSLHSISAQKPNNKKIDTLMKKHVFSASNGMHMPYRLFSSHIDSNAPKPLIIFLHGRGDRGSDNGSKIYREAGLIMNSNSLLNPEMQIKYPCHILVPQCSDVTENEEWAKWIGNSPETPFEGLGDDGSYTMSSQPSKSGEAALELIEQIIDNKNIDANRVYIMGVSMGGFGTWEFISRKPHLFAAAVPMAGYSDPKQLEKIKHISFWIFHGAIDKWNPVEGSRAMYKLLSDSNADVKYTEYDNTGHGESFKKAFNESDLMPWLFSKKKNFNSFQK